jgi:hypothetical protein
MFRCHRQESLRRRVGNARTAAQIFVNGSAVSRLQLSFSKVDRARSCRPVAYRRRYRGDRGCKYRTPGLRSIKSCNAQLTSWSGVQAQQCGLEQVGSAAIRRRTAAAPARNRKSVVPRQDALFPAAPTQREPRFGRSRPSAKRKPGACATSRLTSAELTEGRCPSMSGVADAREDARPLGAGSFARERVAAPGPAETEGALLWYSIFLATCVRMYVSFIHWVILQSDIQ